MNVNLLIFCIISFAPICSAIIQGFDSEVPISVANFQCTKRNGFQFYIARIWRSSGVYDTTGAQNLKNAVAAGYTDISAYMWPCTTTSCASNSATSQMTTLINRLRSDSVPFGNLIWLDIEKGYWHTDKTWNRQFINDLGMGVNIGIYSKQTDDTWGSIVGEDFHALSSYPIWYARYNTMDLMNGWVPFGGWTKPDMKQWSDTYTLPACGVSMDRNIK